MRKVDAVVEEQMCCVGVVFVDFMKAFGHPLENVGIGGGFLLWLKEILANRTQFVIIEGKS